MKKLGIYTTATSNHSYALTAQARCLQSACLAAGIDDPVICLACSNDEFVGKLESYYKELLPKSEVIALKEDGWDNCEAGKYYKNPVQLMIAQMRTASTKRLLAHGCKYILSMDSDVLPPSNAVRCMIDMLKFDNGYYGVAACPYPSQGGGAFLGGRGTPHRTILPCFYEDERIIPKELLESREKMVKAHDAEVAKDKPDAKKIESMLEKLREVEKKIEECPPKANVFALNAEGWRKRGWFDNAYPAIGLGSVVPTEWVGFGCTMMSREAALLCDWSGYNGGGTEDLYICFRRWHANKIKVATIAHCPCDHVVRDRNNPKKFIHVQTYHEIEGECEGHLRQRNVPWYSHDVGEKFDESNDGMHTILEPKTAKGSQ